MTARKPRPESKSLSDWNQERMDEIRARVGDREPAYRLGQTVIAHRLEGKPIGIIDTIYVDFDAVCEGGAVSDSWYDAQAVVPATPKDGLFWYSIILRDGAILQGELDLLSGMDVALLAAAAKEVLGGKP